MSNLDITSITSAVDTDGHTTPPDEHVSVTAGTTVTVNFNYTTASGSGVTNQHAEIWNNSFTGSALETGAANGVTDADGLHSGTVTVGTTGLTAGDYGVKVLVTHKGNGTDQDASAITIVSAVISVTPTVQLNASNAVYTGVAYAVASATTTPDVSGDGTTSIRYYASSTDATADTNAISAPKDVGTYYARAFYVSDGLNHSGTIYQDASSGVSSFDITAKYITGSFTADNKVYDGGTAATVLTRTLNGAISGDNVNLTDGSATFANKNVGTAKTVTLTGASMTGTDANNYVLDSVATTTADITAKHITGSFTADNKVYDGGTAATVLTRTLNGAISGDSVSLSGGTATFANQYAGIGKTVTLTSASLSGGDAGNYALDSVATTTANITYNNSGRFMQPINHVAAGELISSFKVNSTIPVKFGIYKADGSPVTPTDLGTAPTPTISTLKGSKDNETTYVEDVVSTVADQGSNFRYDTTSGLWIFNLNTKGWTAGLKYQITADLGDGNKIQEWVIAR